MKKLPLALIVTAVYFTLNGAFGIVSPLLSFGPNHPEFAAKTTAFRVGAHSREIILSALFLAAGIGIIRRRPWARKLGMVLLPISTIFGGVAFAWGFSRGAPSQSVLWLSFAVVALWNAVWFIVLYRRSTINALTYDRNEPGK
jgi:hypothetical protein